MANYTGGMRFGQMEKTITQLDTDAAATINKLNAMKDDFASRIASVYGGSAAADFKAKIDKQIEEVEANSKSIKEQLMSESEKQKKDYLAQVQAMKDSAPAASN